MRGRHARLLAKRRPLTSDAPRVCCRYASGDHRYSQMGLRALNHPLSLRPGGERRVDGDAAPGQRQESPSVGEVRRNLDQWPRLGLRTSHVVSSAHARHPGPAGTILSLSASGRQAIAARTVAHP
jgi:hypothetical protein